MTRRQRHGYTLKQKEMLNLQHCYMYLRQHHLTIMIDIMIKMSKMSDYMLEEYLFRMNLKISYQGPS